MTRTLDIANVITYADQYLAAPHKFGPQEVRLLKELWRILNMNGFANRTYLTPDSPITGWTANGYGELQSIDVGTRHFEARDIGAACLLFLTGGIDWVDRAAQLETRVNEPDLSAAESFQFHQLYAAMSAKYAAAGPRPKPADLITTVDNWLDLLDGGPMTPEEKTAAESLYDALGEALSAKHDLTQGHDWAGVMWTGVMSLLTEWLNDQDSEDVLGDEFTALAVAMEVHKPIPAWTTEHHLNMVIARLRDWKTDNAGEGDDFTEEEEELFKILADEITGVFRNTPPKPTPPLPGVWYPAGPVNILLSQLIEISQEMGPATILKFRSTAENGLHNLMGTLTHEF